MPPLYQRVPPSYARCHHWRHCLPLSFVHRDLTLLISSYPPIAPTTATIARQNPPFFLYQSTVVAVGCRRHRLQPCSCRPLLFLAATLFPLFPLLSLPPRPPHLFFPCLILCCHRHTPPVVLPTTTLPSAIATPSFAAATTSVAAAPSSTAAASVPVPFTSLLAFYDHLLRCYCHLSPFPSTASHHQ
ncbi:hypothetical protein BHE74_00018331 [Ensete ventricosum]|nr:hypothetical protein BHE74_00018331 [Ensete ventricosum]RZR76973.1 hypothetical protein BHM03_00001900 [Ensete ventricosum]